MGFISPAISGTLHWSFGSGRRSRQFMRKKLDIQEAPDDVWPICPHCKKELKFIWVKSKGIEFYCRYRTLTQRRHGFALLA